MLFNSVTLTENANGRMAPNQGFLFGPEFKKAEQLKHHPIDKQSRNSVVCLFDVSSPLVLSQFLDCGVHALVGVPAVR